MDRDRLLHCRVLGPLEVDLDGVRLDLGGPLPRRLLAALLAAERATVSDTALADAVWVDRPPANVSSALHVTVSRLRSALGPTGRSHLIREQGGYRFGVAAELTDCGRFAAHVADGSRLLAGGRADEAAHAFSSALRLWRGTPWTELGDAASVTGARARLVEMREVAVEELQAARLATGDAAGAVADLGEAVAAMPYRERRWELLVLGLYRSGRCEHARAELRRVRELLADELGVNPGPALRTLEQRLVDQDPSLLEVDTSLDQRRRAPLPPPRTIGTRPGPPDALARPRSTFVGRGGELALLAGPLAGQRLVTLLGPAGVGKTRLVLEHLARAEGGDEVRLVRLADVPGPEAVARAVADVLGVDGSHAQLAPAIAGALADAPGLLVLDNCEHVTDAVGELVMELLDGCPALRILTTSRAPLAIDGEQVVTLEPLAVIGDDNSDGDAVTLLIDRVRVRRPQWHPTESELVSARCICAELDGLPLAIELAAARERAFGLGGVAAHLHDRFTLLGPAPKGSLTHHATLWAAISWSIELLPEADKSLLLRLWPFEGGFSWQAAAAVQPAGCTAAVQPAGRARRPVLSTLASLVDRSVLLANTTTTPTRYRMLESVRGYCQRADPDPDRSRAAHAAWTRDLAARHAPKGVGPEAAHAFDTLITELPNIRAGIAHDLEHRRVEVLRTLSELEYLWSSSGSLTEGRTLLRRALRTFPDAGTSDRVPALLALSILSYHSGTPEDSVQLAEQAIGLLELDADPSDPLLVKALLYRSAGAAQCRDRVRCRDSADRLASAMDPTTPAWVRASATLALGSTEVLEGDERRGAATLRAARDLSQRCGYLWGQGTAELALARVVVRDTEADVDSLLGAVASSRRAVAIFTDQSDGADVLTGLYTGACALGALGRTGHAVRLRAAVLAHADRMGIDRRRYALLAGPSTERRPDLIMTSDQRSDTERAGAAMGWPAMLELFDRSAEGVLGGPRRKAS